MKADMLTLRLQNKASTMEKESQIITSINLILKYHE